MNQKTTLIAVVALVVGFGAGYFVHTPPAPAAGTRGSFAGAGGGAFTGARGGAAGGGLLTGTVAASDSGSLTLDTRDGSSHVVLVTPATTVSKSVNGTLGDVSVGSTVIVSGTANSDGSLSATNIQLRPALPAI
ncbi:MAG: hypothetical protein B7W96_00775 [Parcubacteria group bacterium 37-58-5]|nr:MAG: hypothetical protein B7W96_00775 [Parcubacteria group bacterium 37-58-5]